MIFLKSIRYLLLFVVCIAVGQVETDSLTALLKQPIHDTTRANVLNQLASKSFYKDPLVTDSLTTLSIALSLANDHPVGVALGYKLKGISYAIRGNYDEARELYTKAMERFETLNRGGEIASLHYMIGITYLETGQIKKAEESYASALNAQKRINDSLGVANTYVGIANFHKQVGNLDLGLTYLDSALYLYTALNRPSEIAIVRNSRANIFITRNNYPKALDEIQQALQYNESNGLEQKIAVNYHTIGTIYTELNEYEKAKEYYEKSIAIKEKLGMEGGVAMSLSNLAAIHLRQDNLVEARKGFERVRDIYLKLNHACQVVYSELNLGSIHRQIGQRDSAYYYQKKVIAGCEECGMVEVAVDAQVALGEMYLEDGNRQQAELLFLQAQQAARDAAIKRGELKATENLFQLYKTQGNLAEALSYLERSSTLKDSLYNEENNRELARVESQYAFDKEKAILNETFKRRQIEQEAALEKQIWIRNTVLAMALLVLLFGVASLFYYLKIKQKNKLLEGQNLQITHQNTKLELLNHNNKKLLSLLAHDLRAPLGNLLGIFTLVKLRSLSDEKIESLSRDIDFRVKSLLDFLDNVLNWSKYHFSGITPNKVKMNLDQVINETVDLLQPIAERKHLSIQTKLDSPFWIHADPAMLKVILRNILSNAIKFSNDHGSISICAERAEQELRIWVQDEGIGMTEDIKGKLFSETLASNPGTHNEMGAGMGLFLTNDFVKAHHGVIDVESEPGNGSRFTVRLPATTESLTPQEV